MTEPQTVNRGLIIPNTGALPGTWGSDAINPDMVALDGMLGGFATVSLSNLNVTLTAPVGFIATPSSGPTQSQTGILTFTGALTGNVIITFPLPGFYIVENLCTNSATFFVKLKANGVGQTICAPPGEACHVYNNGTDFRYVNLGRIGSYVDLSASSVPVWVTNCTVPPYLNCDGTAFSAVTYPTLNAYLGGTTLPDLRGRTRFALNGGTSRITSAVSGIDGNVLLASGGVQGQTLVQANLPSASFVVDIPAGQGSHTHTISPTVAVQGSAVLAGGGNGRPAINQVSATQGNTLPALAGTAASGGTDTPMSIMPPAQISGITLIRAG